MKPAWFALVCWLLVAAACGREDIVVATIDPPTQAPTSSQSSGEKHHPSPCFSSEDCKADDFCEKKFCAEPEGVCRPRPVSCELGLPVCGCGGLPFPSDCIRRAAGVASSRPGPCGPH